MKHTEFGHSITFIAQDWDTHPDFTHTNISDIGDYDSDISKSPYKRLHIDKNTWENWGLVPDSRPTLSHPAQKTKIADSNSINGVMDLSWSTSKYPLFGNREGSFTFIYNPIYQQAYNKYKPWLVLYSEISEFLHGRKLRMILEDDPGYYYEGRFWVENWTSNNDGSGSTITIGYSVDPYKMSIVSSLNDWIWDPFNFYDGVITKDSFTIETQYTGNIMEKENYHDIIHTGDNDSYWYGKTGEQNSKLDLFGLMGTKPQNPIIHWKPTIYNEDASGTTARQRCLIVNFVNYGYGIDYGKSGIRYKYFDPLGSYGQGTSLSSSGVRKVNADKDKNGFYQFIDSDMLFGDNYVGEYQFIQFIGKGTVKIEFRRGSL